MPAPRAVATAPPVLVWMTWGLGVLLVVLAFLAFRKHGLAIFAFFDPFDQAIIRRLNQSSQNTPALDRAINFLSVSLLFKGAWVVALLWYFWFSQTGKVQQRRVRITVLAILCAAPVAVLMFNVIGGQPFRLRPMHALPDFRTPLGMADSDFRLLWFVNSFPSGHATMFSGLTAGLFLLSRKTGLAAAALVWALILAPRVYLGYHYPSDCLVGFVVGALFSLLGIFAFTRFKPLVRLLEALLDQAERHRALFYGAFFLISLEYASLFENLRYILRHVSQMR